MRGQRSFNCFHFYKCHEFNVSELNKMATKTIATLVDINYRPPKKENQ